MQELDKDILARIRGQKQSALDVASQQGDSARFDIVREQASVDLQERQDALAEDQSFGQRAAKSAGAALDMSAAAAITDEIGMRTAAALEEDNFVDGLKSAVFMDPFKDDQFNMDSDKDLQAMALGDMESRGLDLEGPQARALGTARSQLEYDIRLAEIDKTLENMKHVQESGVFAGAVPFFTSSLLDVDIVVGGGIYTKAKSARRAKMLADAQKVSKVTKGSRKLDNIIDGSIAGGLSAIMTEGTNAALDPAKDSGDLLGAVVMSTAMGAGIGGILPSQRVDDFIESTQSADIAKRMMRHAQKDQKLSDFNRSMDFVLASEGKFANVQGDIGGRTMMGITEKWYPKQFNDIMRIQEKHGDKAAKRYAQSFYKKEFYDKVVDDSMTPEQKMVMMDTAVIAGPKRAKEFFNQSKGDVDEFLNIRESYHRDRANNPEQGQFLDGWVNRVNNLRTEAGKTSTGRSVPENENNVLSDVLSSNESTLSTKSRMRIKLDEARSVGAARVVDPDRPDIEIGVKSQEIIDVIEEELSQHDLATGIREFSDFTDETASLPVRMLQKNAERLYKGLDTLRLTPDYDKAMLSDNAPLQWMAIKLMNSPLGQIANSRNADNIADLLETQARAQYAPQYSDRYQGWAKSKGYDFKDRNLYTKAHGEFGREVQTYLAHKLKGEEIKANQHVIDAAGDIQNGYKMMLDNHKKHGTEGFEDIEWKDGHFKVIWDKESWLRTEKEVGTANVTQAVKQGIMKMSPDIDENMAFILANAIKRNAINHRQGSPVSSLMTLSEDGRKTLEDVLRENGVPESQITGRVDSILYKDSDSGTVKSSRRRIEVDYTTRIPGTDKTLLDLVNNDIYGTLDSVTRGQSAEIGRVAATDGVLQKRDIPSYIQAVEDYARLNGQDPTRAVQIAEDIFSQFNEGAYGGGVTAFTSRLNRASRLSFLAQLGITQAAETGIMMSKSNIGAFQKFLGRDIKNMIGKMDNSVVDAISAHGKYYRPDELQGRVLNLDEVNFGSADSLKVPFVDAPHLGKALDTTLDKGQRLMGSVSGFYHMTGIQQRVSAEINLNYLMNGVRDGSISQRRLAAMNVDDTLFDVIKKHTDKVERDADGHITDLRIEDWDMDELDKLRAVIKQNIDYDVQKTRRGQDHSFTNKNDLAAVFTNLKTFAMNAMYSKALRNARLADRQAAAEMAYNLAWSSIAVTAHAAVNGKLDKLDGETLARRTLNWSAHVSPTLMLTDPIAYMTGMDYIGDNGSSPLQRYRYAQDGLIGMPAPLAAAGQLLGVGRTPADLLDDGELDRNTVNSLKAVPVVGRMYGVPWMLDEYYKSIKE